LSADVVVSNGARRRGGSRRPVERPVDHIHPIDSIPGGQAHKVHGVIRLADRDRGVVTMTGQFDWFLQQHRDQA
jgi:hypothetical protein